MTDDNPHNDTIAGAMPGCLALFVVRVIIIMMLCVIGVVGVAVALNR